MTRRYASETSVTVAASRAEIERLLARYGADQFAYGANIDKAMVGFRMEGRMVRFVLNLPNLRDFARTPNSQQRRSEEATRAAWEQACRSSWRALALVVKAKLEAVAAGITTFEEEFLAHIVLPDGMTVAEHVRPSIAAAYEGKNAPRLLPDFR